MPGCDRNKWMKTEINEPNKEMSSIDHIPLYCVLRPWIYNLSWKQQTTLMTCFRGPDIHSSEQIKGMIRWIRMVCLNNAAPKKKFMKKRDFFSVEEAINKEPFVFDGLPLHFWSHLLNAFVIIGYKHPEEKIRSFAYKIYIDLVNYMHLNPESEAHLDYRLSDEL